MALLRASMAVDGGKLTHDEEVGYNIIRRACRRSPDPDCWQRRCRRGRGLREGFGSQGQCRLQRRDGVYEDLVKCGVIDPVKVTRSALVNAASVATLLLTSDALIAEKPKDDKKDGHHDDHGDM